MVESLANYLLSWDSNCLTKYILMLYYLKIVNYFLGDKMNDQTKPLEAQDDSLYVHTTYSMPLQHVAKLSEMAIVTGKSKSELVRNGIDLLYAKTVAEPQS